MDGIRAGFGMLLEEFCKAAWIKTCIGRVLGLGNVPAQDCVALVLNTLELNSNYGSFFGLRI